jgi:hypothetical protein
MSGCQIGTEEARNNLGALIGRVQFAGAGIVLTPRRASSRQARALRQP